jgi:predicted phosphodiesterase
MTRLAVLADIHGNLTALNAVIADLSNHPPIDHGVAAGDNINVGPESLGVMQRLVELGWALIRGNHEFYYLDYGTQREPSAHKDFTLPRWLHQTLPRAWFNRIAALPDTLTLYYPDAPPLRVCHGIPGSHWQGIYAYPEITPDEDAAKLLEGATEDYVILGHTHQTMNRRIQGAERCWQVFNPGSAGLPLHGKPGYAHYMILEGSPEGWIAEQHQVPYDMTPLWEAFERAEYLAHTGVVGQLLMDEFRTAQTRVVPFKRWAEETYGDSSFSQERLEVFSTLPLETVKDYMTPAFRFAMERG